MKKKYGLYIIMAVLTLSATLLAGCKKEEEEVLEDESLWEEELDVSENEVDELLESEDGTYYVNSIKDLLEAIRPETEIFLEPGYYNLSEYTEELWKTEGAKWNESHPYVQLQECSDGVEVVIQDVSGLYITGDSDNVADTEIVVDSGCGAVFNFVNCSDMMLQMMTVGNTGSGECSSNLLNFSGCSNVELYVMDLYGGGACGIGAEAGCRDFYITESVIRECPEGPFSIAEASGVFEFMDCVLTDSEGAGFYEVTEDSDLSFYGCTFGEMESEGLYFRDDIYTEDCIWSEEYEDYSDFDEWEDEEFEEEDFEEEDEWEDEFDVSNWQQVPLDNEVLEYSYWMGYALIDPQSGRAEYLPYEKPDGSEIDVSVELDEAGLGWIEYNGESYEISWAIDSAYSVSFRSDALNASGTVYGEPYEEDVIMWMKLTLDGYTFWLY